MAAFGSPRAKTRNYVRQEAWDRASLSRRLSAWLIDLALLVTAVLVAATLLGLSQPRHGSWTTWTGPS